MICISTYIWWIFIQDLEITHTNINTNGKFDLRAPTHTHTQNKHITKDTLAPQAERRVSTKCTHTDMVISTGI